MGRLDFPLRLLVGVLVLYVLVVGGTFNGMVNMQFSQTTLILLSLAILAWLALRWQRGWVWQGTILDWALLAGAVAAILSALANLDVGRRITLGLWYWGLYLAVWLLLVDLVANGLPARWLLDGVIATGVPVVLIGYWQAGGWLVGWQEVTSAGIGVPFIPVRPGSLIGNPNALGTFLVVLIPLLLSCWVQARRWPGRVGWGVYALLSVGMLLLTLSRGAWLGFGAALALWLVAALWIRGLLSWAGLRRWWMARGRVGRGALIGLAVAVLAAGVVIAPVLFGAVNQPSRTFSTREAIWGAALDAFARQPLTGAGPFTFGRTLLAHQSTPPLTPHSHAHNLVLQVAAELGLPGMAALAFGLGLAGIGLWRRFGRLQTSAARLELAACIAALVGFGVHHLLDTTMMMPSITLLALLILAAALVEPESTVPVGRPARLSLRGAIAVGLWGVLLASGWWSHGIQATYIQALLRADDGEWMAGAADLASVVASDPQLALYPAEQGYVLGVATAQDEPGAAEAGITAFERALAVEDVYAPWWANLAVLRWAAGDEEGAVRDMQSALDRAPLAAQFWLTQGTFYEALGDMDQAEAAYLQALDLRPEWRASGFWDGSELRARARNVFDVANPQEPTRLDDALAALVADRTGDAQAILLANPTLGRASVAERVVLALCFELQGDPLAADRWQQSAELAAQFDWEEEWLAVGRAILADWRGDPRADAAVEAAQYQLFGSPRGTTFPTGQNLTWAQFLRDGIPEQLLPQIVTLPINPRTGQLLGWALDRD